MSLTNPGVWRAGVWEPTVWTDGVWLEETPAPRRAVFSDMLMVEPEQQPRRTTNDDDDVLAILAAVMPLIAGAENYTIGKP